MENRTGLGIALLVCFQAGIALAADKPSAGKLPKVWTGVAGWKVVSEGTRIQEGKRVPGDLLIEYQTAPLRMAVVQKTVQTKHADGRDFILPEGTKLFAENFRDPDGKKLLSQRDEAIEWCGVLPKGIDGKQDASATICLAWENPTTAMYMQDDRTGGFAYSPRVDRAKGAPGPLPRLKEQPVDLGVEVFGQMRLMKITPERVEVTKVLTDRVSELNDQEYLIPWEKARNAVVTSNGQRFDIYASWDYKDVIFRHLGPVPAPKPPGVPIVRVCLDKDGAFKRDPEIVTSSGSAQLDEAALKVAKSGRYKAAKGTQADEVDPDCFKFRVQFQFKD
jgi:hypothetical protein